MGGMALGEEAIKLLLIMRRMLYAKKKNNEAKYFA